jgi:hypothetical protein
VQLAVVLGQGSWGGRLTGWSKVGQQAQAMAGGVWERSAARFEVGTWGRGLTSGQGVLAAVCVGTLLLAW